jgi:ADP-heptose:LPS heptosyltransferase
MRPATPQPQAPAPRPAEPPDAPPRNLPRRVIGQATRPLRRWIWEQQQMLRAGGRPTTLLVYGNGFGDHLLCTTLFRELRRRGHRGLWMMSNHPELFDGNPDVDAVVPMDYRYPELAQRHGGRSCMPNYAEIIEAEDRSIPPQHHILTCMCKQAAIAGEISLRPYFHLTREERGRGRLAPRQIAIQSTILSASMPIRNKEWLVERFQAVVDALGYAFTFVQVGLESDPQLKGVIDLRGKATVRQTAAVMSQSLVFVGLVGFLMHLARSVDCRSVIVYGGREAPWQSGYSCNENLFTSLPCAPCWLWSKCDFGHRCMKEILPQHVITAVENQVDRCGSPLAVDTDVLTRSGDHT